MLTAKQGLIAISLTALALVYPQLSSAETFTSKEFLTWKPEHRIAYFRNSISMTGVIATQFDSGKARCIDEWHARQDRAGHPILLEAARTYPDYHPQGIVLWVLQKECGKLNPDD